MKNMNKFSVAEFGLPMQDNGQPIAWIGQYNIEPNIGEFGISVVNNLWTHQKPNDEHNPENLVAIFCCRPKKSFRPYKNFMLFLDSVKYVSPEEGYRITDEEECKRYSRIHIYCDGLFICEYRLGENTWYWMPLDCGDFHTKNLLELQLRLYEYQYPYDDKHSAFKKISSRITWLIALSDMVHGMKILNEKWSELDNEEDFHHCRSKYPFGESFDLQTLMTIEWLEEQIKLI